MDNFPKNLHIIDGFNERVEQKILRTEFEDGYIKQSNNLSCLRYVYDLKYYAYSKVDYEVFLIFYAKNRARYFIWQHPRKNSQVLARLVGGDYKASVTDVETYSNKTDAAYQINLTIEVFE